MGFEGFLSMAKEARQKGTVNMFNDIKGFGFISPHDGSEEVFVHHSSIKTDGVRSLLPGEAVEFQVSCGDDGRPNAVDVTVPDRSPVQGPSGGRGGGGDRSYGGRDCYNCGQSGHMSRDCTQ